ncbi:sulfatase-like hydrolase/transferase [Halobacterium bonnevillei]|uniref:Sulfatase-like hydrolase/transferase n=1 Tax=Halobacterium bonnevillei TaxID=2692200 RepID=A0A6B0SEA8_9EURY|nr:sulfatase-like hydrolase/transferase [Halobacterium bonnevillei]MXR20064.1 sulfatase-like hydrolase/transferase [Halobacterium bonnevillei]
MDDTSTVDGPADERSDDSEGDAPTEQTVDSPNLLLVCVDCLRQDFLHRDAVDTPFLDSLRADGMECTDLYATATTTTPAIASLLTGAYSEHNGIQSLRRGSLADDVDPMAEILGDAGYHTEAMATGPLMPETGLDRGFDAYECRDEDASLFGDWREDALDRLAGLPEPFAAFVHLWELHEDIHVPREYDTREYGETPYGRALSALDREIEALVDIAPDDTVVAVVGDHGESITHRNNPLRLAAKSLRDALKYYGGVDTRDVAERVNQYCDRFGPDVDDHFLENGHGENVFDFTTNVPFVLAGPGVQAGTVDAQVRQIDVLPTILDALAVDRETDGDVVEPGIGDRVAYMRACGASLHRERNWARAVRYGDAKYVEYPERDWSPGVYDLSKHPRELARVDDPDLEADLSERLPERGVDPTDVEMLEINERLEDLGYL